MITFAGGEIDLGTLYHEKHAPVVGRQRHRGRVQLIPSRRHGTSREDLQAARNAGIKLYAPSVTLSPHHWCMFSWYRVPRSISPPAK